MFGISTHCLSDKSLIGALDCLSPLTDTVEVMNDGLHYTETAEPLQSYNFRYFMHAPARGVNVASQLEPIRIASVEVIGKCFDVAGEVDAAVVVHPGYFAWRQERERAISQFKRSLEELKEMADERSINFYIENMPNWEHFFLRSPDDITLIGDVDLALDVGHAHLNACLDTFLKCPAAHFHLHDNMGTEDSHDAIGSGEIDFKAVMAAVKKNRAVPMIEVNSFEAALRSIDVLKTL